MVLHLQCQAGNEGPPLPALGQVGCPSMTMGQVAVRHIRSYSQCIMYQIDTTTALCLNKPVVIFLFLADPHYILQSRTDCVADIQPSDYIYSAGSRTDIYLLQFSYFQIFRFIYSVSSCAE